MSGALEGLKVVDLTLMLAGPYCSLLLADHGAEVIKVEPPAGDAIRGFGPHHPDDRLKAFGGYFQSINRNKRSIVLDLKQADAREALLKLIDRADVVMENYRAGVMERLGLSYEMLQARNPRLVYAAIRGFGDARSGESPYLNWPAFDVVAQAMGGVMAITGPDKDTLVKVGPGIGDVFPAVLCAFGIMAAVFRAQRTGQGQFVDVGMADSILALCERTIYQHSYSGAVPGPEGTRHPIFCPFGMFRARDGWITIAVVDDHFWFKLCALIGRDDLGKDPALTKGADRVRQADRIVSALEAFTSARTKAELSALFGGEVPYGPVYDVADIFNDAHFRARDMLIDVLHPGVDTPLKIAGVPIKMSRTPGGIRHGAPLLGEHTDAVLAEIGYDAAAIKRLRATKAAL